MVNIPLHAVADPVQLPDRVHAYRNLNKKGPNGEPVWSVRDAATNKVLAHVHHIAIADVVTTVRAAGQARVRRESRKNVHAWLVGRPITVDQLPHVDPVAVTYNPYTNSAFMAAGNPVHDLDHALLDSRGCHGWLASDSDLFAIGVR